MPVFDQGYQNWAGKLSGVAWRWWTIARRGFGTAIKYRRIRIVLFFAISPAIVLATVLALWGLIEQKAEWAEVFLKTFSLPDELFSDRARLRNVVWTMAFHYFFVFELHFALLLTLLAGPELISQDLRFNAMPLYLSRPVRRIDYFAGKLGVIALLLSVVTLVPSVFAWVLGIAFSLDLRVIRDASHLLWGSLVFSAVVIASAGGLILAFSSLSRNSRIVGSLWIGMLMISTFASQILSEQVRKPWCELVSYSANLMRMERSLLGVSVAGQQILDIQNDLMKVAQSVGNMGSRSPFGLGIPGGGGQKGKKRFVPPPPPRPPDFRGQPAYFEQLANEPTPAWWSFSILSGLFAASALVLTQRVKSLDRLK